MRHFFALALLVLLLSPVAHGGTRALIVSEQPSEPRRERILDRSGARTLLRLTAPRKQRRVEPNLKHEADLTTLERPLLVRRGELGKIIVDGATTLRLRVAGAPRGTAFLVAGEGDETFERFEPDEFTTWTPTIREELSVANRAIALIRFVRGDASYVCTGGLVNDANDSGAPYFLTARHCISTQAEAASIEAVWDDRSTTCGVTNSSTRSTRTYGAELLVASADTDVALLRLNNIPPNRVFLGVELSPLAAGTTTYRLSHAEGKPQKYSSGTVRTSGAGCAAAPRLRYIYTTPTEGAVAMGSSGAPLLVPGRSPGRCSRPISIRREASGDVQPGTDGRRAKLTSSAHTTSRG